MSPDELIVTAGAAVVGLIAWIVWLCGIMIATLLQKNSLSIAPDLAHVLRRWQESGIQVRVIDVATGQSADNVAVPKPSGFKLAWYAAIALFGLRRSNVGGFGSMIPEQTSRSGFYG